MGEPKYAVELLDITDRWIAEQIWALQHLAYAVEARIIGLTNLSPLTDTIVSLQGCKDLFYGIIIEDQLIGVLSAVQSDDKMTINRVMVRPNYYRQGIAYELLRHIEFQHRGVRMFLVNVNSHNMPAISLYESLCYHSISERTISEGMKLVEYCKIMGSAGINEV